MNLEKNEIVPIGITGYTAEGSGVGHCEGLAVFVPSAARGDRLRVRILKTAKSHAFGKIEELTEPSRHRTPPDCAFSGRCGGCAFRHISYEEELWAKQQRVKDAIERIGGFSDLPIRQILGADKTDGYRNKAQIPLGMADGKLVMGFYAPRSHRIINCEACALQPVAFAQAMDAFRDWFAKSGEPVYDETSGKGRLRHLYLRLAEATGEVMVCVVVNGNGFHGEQELAALLRERIPGLKSVLVNSNREKTNVVLGKRTRVVWGADHITDVLCGRRFAISPLSFYQVNRSQAERLYRVAAEYASPEGGLLLDLYCGAGTIGLSMADQADRLIGVEIVEQAVRDARENASRNQVENAEFLCADAAEAARLLERRGERPKTVVVDPPRKGCAPELLKTIACMEPERIVYVSCDPATLARDLRLLREPGYLAQELTPVDMFPRTAHVETVALLQRKG